MSCKNRVLLIPSDPQRRVGEAEKAGPMKSRHQRNSLDASCKTYMVVEEGILPLPPELPGWRFNVWWWISRRLSTDVLEVEHEVRHRVLRHHSHIHGPNVVFDRVEFSEIEAAHGFELLVVRGGLDGDGFLDETPLMFLGKCVGVGACHVYDGMLVDFSGG
jgi:hypothetical protein